jgi:hypothetical protein
MSEVASLKMKNPHSIFDTVGIIYVVRRLI